MSSTEFTMKLLFSWASPVDRVNRKPNVVLVNDSNSTYGVRPAGEEDQHDPFSWPVWQAQPRTHVWYRDQQMEELDDPERATVGYFN